MPDATDDTSHQQKGFWAGEWEHLHPIVSHFLVTLLFELCVGISHLVGNGILPTTMRPFADRIEFWVFVTTVLLFALWFVIFYQ